MYHKHDCTADDHRFDMCFHSTFFWPILGVIYQDVIDEINAKLEAKRLAREASRDLGDLSSVVCGTNGVWIFDS